MQDGEKFGVDGLRQRSRAPPTHRRRDRHGDPTGRHRQLARTARRRRDRRRDGHRLNDRAAPSHPSVDAPATPLRETSRFAGRPAEPKEVVAPGSAWMPIGELSRRIGVSPDLLRKWEQRYWSPQPDARPATSACTRRSTRHERESCCATSATACPPPRPPNSRSERASGSPPKPPRPLRPGSKRSRSRRRACMRTGTLRRDHRRTSAGETARHFDRHHGHQRHLAALPSRDRLALAARPPQRRSRALRERVHPQPPARSRSRLGPRPGPARPTGLPTRRTPHLRSDRFRCRAAPTRLEDHLPRRRHPRSRDR